MIHPIMGITNVVVAFELGDLVMTRHLLLHGAPWCCPPLSKENDLMLFKLVNWAPPRRFSIRVVQKVSMFPHLRIQGDECEEVEGFPMDQFRGMVELNKLKKNSIKDHKFKAATLRLWYSWACLVKQDWNLGLPIQNSTQNKISIEWENVEV
jgi:hypothetical protein